MNLYESFLETLCLRAKKTCSVPLLKMMGCCFYLQIIFENTRMLSKLVEELFAPSELDANQIKSRTEPFSLPELTQDSD